MLSSRLHSQLTRGGFGLIELMVSIGILALITTMVMIRHSSFNSSVLEETQAYEVAFDIRQTQMRAVSPQFGITNDIRGGYGVRFLTTDNRTYEIFQETGDGEIVIDRRQLDPRFRFELPLLENNDVTTIFFQRPDFDARFKDSQGNLAITVDELVINISMVGDSGFQSNGRDIEVTSTGQITIRRGN